MSEDPEERGIGLLSACVLVVKGFWGATSSMIIWLANESSLDVAEGYRWECECGWIIWIQQWLWMWIYGNGKEYAQGKMEMGKGMHREHVLNDVCVKVYGWVGYPYLHPQHWIFCSVEDWAIHVNCGRSVEKNCTTFCLKCFISLITYFNGILSSLLCSCQFVLCYLVVDLLGET